MLFSCTDPKDNPELTTTGKVTFELSHFWGKYDSADRKEFKLNETFYSADRKDTVKFSLVEYDVQDIAFRSLKGGVWKDNAVHFSVKIGDGGQQSVSLDSVKSGEYDLVRFYLTNLRINGERIGSGGNKVIAYDLTAVENDRLFSKETSETFKVDESASPKIHLDVNIAGIWSGTLDLQKDLEVNGTSKEAASAASYFASSWLLERVVP